MIPPIIKEHSPGGFNPTHFAVLCVIIFALKVRFVEFLHLREADCVRSFILASAAPQDACQDRGTPASHIFDLS